VTDKT